MEVMTKERPIIFSAPMVRAILEGRKTQTRRIVKPQPVPIPIGPSRSGLVYTAGWFEGGDVPNYVLKSCPYGQPGDRLWVRETWAMMPECHPADSYPIYRATDPGWDDNESGLRWKPSIYMPHWASRITLEITGVRVERLNEISRGDAMNEGCPYPNMADGPDPRIWLMCLWESINGHGSWDANPWTWVIEFKKITP